MIRFMHVFEPSYYVGDCEACGERFDPVYGGACPSCRRLLCSTHLYGSRWQRLRGYFGREVQCVDCRSSVPVGRSPDGPPGRK